VGSLDHVRSTRESGLESYMKLLPLFMSPARKYSKMHDFILHRNRMYIYFFTPTNRVPDSRLPLRTRVPILVLPSPMTSLSLLQRRSSEGHELEQLRDHIRVSSARSAHVVLPSRLQNDYSNMCHGDFTHQLSASSILGRYGSEETSTDNPYPCQSRISLQHIRRSDSSFMQRLG